MNRFIRRAFVFLGWTLAALAMLVVLILLEEDWRGPHDWAAYQRELAAKGETLDLRKLAPPGPADCDLSKIELLTMGEAAAPERYIGLIGAGPPPPEHLKRLDVCLGADSTRECPSFKGNGYDLAAWQKFYRSLPEANMPAKVGTPAQDVLAALSQFDSQIDEIEAAISKPGAYWSVDYDHPFLSPLEGRAFMITLARVLALRAVAHLDNQETTLAERDYLSAVRLCLPLSRGCSIVNYLYIQAVQAITVGILREGLQRHAWTAQQLVEMESALASIDLIALSRDSFRIERAGMIQMTKVYQNPSPHFLASLEYEERYEITIWQRLSYFRPEGWWDQDRISYCKNSQVCIDGIKAVNGTIDPAIFTAEYPPWSFWKVIYTPITLSVGRNLLSFGHPIVKAETNRRLARIACHLEEYRIAHGQYPATLGELPDLPVHLNQEVLSTAPFRYQRKVASYLLYSVGINQKDDGGVPAADFPPGHSDDLIGPSP